MLLLKNIVFIVVIVVKGKCTLAPLGTVGSRTGNMPEKSRAAVLP